MKPPMEEKIEKSKILREVGEWKWIALEMMICVYNLHKSQNRNCVRGGGYVQNRAAKGGWWGSAVRELKRGESSSRLTCHRPRPSGACAVAAVC